MKIQIRTRVVEKITEYSSCFVFHFPSNSILLLLLFYYHKCEREIQNLNKQDYFAFSSSFQFSDFWRHMEIENMITVVSVNIVKYLLFSF